MSAADTALTDKARGLLEAHPCRGVKINHLAQVLAAARLRRLGNGDALITEGEAGDELYFLLDGSVRVQRRDSKGRMRELAVMQAPCLVGHMSLVDNSPRSASCLAEGRTVVAALDRKTYNDILTEASPRGTALRRLLLASLTRQLADANGRIQDLIDGSNSRAQAKRLEERKRREEEESRLRAEARAEAEAVEGRAMRRDVNAVEDFDVSDTDILRVAGVLNGWDVDTTGAESMKVVFTEDQKRNAKNRWTK